MNSGDADAAMKVGFGAAGREVEVRERRSAKPDAASASRIVDLPLPFSPSECIDCRQLEAVERFDGGERKRIFVGSVADALVHQLHAAQEGHASSSSDLSPRRPRARAFL